MHHRIEYHHKTGARLLSLLLCILFLFSVDPAVSGALVVPVQAASAGVAAAATRGISGLQTLASDLSVRFGGMFSGFSAWLLSITPDPDVDPDAPHNLPEVYWNVNPNDQVDANTNDVLLYGGNDENDGATAETPVLTWERAMQLVAAGGKIWEMNTDTANVTGARSGEVEGQAVTVDFYGKNPLLYLTGTPVGAETVTDLTLSYLNMFDLTEAEDPSNDKRLVTMQGGTLTLDAGMTMRGDVLIEKFADETANAPSPEIYVTQAFADDFAANMNITLKFYCNEHTCHTNSGDKTAFDFIVFPEGFDASVALNSIHLHSSLTTNFGDDLLIWKVRVKPDEGCGNIIQVYLAEPYDGAVYLSGIGDDANDGLYPDTPVKTYERAVQILTGTAPDSAEINAYRQEHGDYEPNEGIIRICGAPVHIYTHIDANDQPIVHSETWSMPAGTYWYDNNGNVVSPSWVERYKNYQGDMILVEPFVQFTLTDITVKGNRALQPNAEGSILVVSSLGSATIGENALLTENHARVGGGVRMEGFLPTVTLNGGNIVNCYANRYVDAGTEVYGAGGGVYAFTGVFNMLKGEIRGCRAIYGGGVFIDHAVLGDTNVPIACDFRLKGNGVDPCRIVNCSAEYGGGVYTRQKFTLLSTDTTDTDFEAVSGCACRIPVTGCTAVYYGAGWAAESTTFIIDGGEVTGNSITINETNGVGGAGVYALNSYFKMINGGSVHGNNIRTNSVKGTPAAVGGGVYCQNVPLPLTDENDPAVVLQYPVEIGEGCEIFDNHIYSGNKTVNMRGAGLAIAGAALRVCVIDGLIHDNTFNLQQIGTGWGAGIFCTNSPMQLAAHCRVYNNGMEGQSTVYGCGVYHYGGVLWLDGCEIDHNFHTPTSFSTNYSCYTYGGGIYKENPNPGANNPNLEFHLRSGSIHDNAIGSYTNYGVHMGGGVYAADYVDVKLHTGFEIKDNAGFGQGGGIFLRGEHSTLSCTGTQVMGAAALITGNTAMRTSTWASENGRGGGIYVYQAASVQLSRVYFSGNNAGLGGGVCVERTPSVQISHCTFRDNDATSTVSDTSNRAPGGAGIYVTNHFITDLNTAVEIMYCNFYGNYGKARGGAVYVDGTNSRYTYSANDSRFRFYRIRLDGCVFGDGTAGGANTAGVENDTNFNGMGGAVFHYAGELTVADCEFNRNSSTWRGGAIYAAYENSYPQPSNITGDTVFTDNAAGNMGGAIYNDRARMNINGGEDGTVSFTGNSAPVRGGAVCTNTNELHLDHCEFFRNSMTFTPVVGTDGVWFPMITQGLDVASNQAWVYMNPETVTANEFYFHHRSYCLRIDHPVPVYPAPEPTPENPEPEAPDPWSLKIELNVTEGSYYRGGDHVVEPDPAGAHLSNAEPYVSNFRLEGAAADAYNLVAYNRCLVLADKSVYIDGVNGDDLNDGMTPTTAVKTFPAARQKLVALLNGNPEAKKEIYVVNTVTVSDTQNWTFQGDTMPTGTEDEDPIQIYGVKMIAYVADNTWNTARKAMILVDGGNLTFYGITLDGNRSAFSQKCATYGFHVKNNGRLKVENLGRVQNHYMGIYAEGNSAPENTPYVELDTAVVTNCQNHYSRTYSSGSDPYRETSAAGVTVKYGTLKIDEVEISGCIGFRKGGGMYLDTVSADISWLTVKTCRVQEPTNFYIQDWYGSYNGDYYSYFVNRTAAYSGVGGGAYFWNSDVTMSATDFTQCANPSYSGDNKHYPGLALAVRGGTLEADRCDFTENGYQTLSSDSGPYYGYGVVHISGAAVVDLMRCRFTKNYSYYGGAIRLDMGRMVRESQNGKSVYYAVDAPTLYLRGCEFGSSDEADANRTCYGGSAVWSQGHEHEHPKVYFYDYNEVADGELVATHTVVQNNRDYNCNGAVYAVQTDLVAQNAVFRGNRILYLNSSFPYGWPTGGAAIHSHGGSLSLEGCTVTNNQTLSRYGTSWSTGAVFADQCDSIRVTGNTEFTGNEVVTSYNSINYSLYGSGMCIRSCADALIEDTVFSDNRLRVASFDYYNYNLAAAGALHAESSTITVRRVDCINNKHNISKQQRVRFYGAAMHLYNCIAVLEDFYASNNVTPGNIDVTLSSARFTGFKAGVSVEKDIMLYGNTTPISLLSPLTGQGELKLRFDETFGGRHIVCGYTDDETEEGYPTWDANHDYTGYPHDVPAGTLNAWQYLETGSNPRFAAAAAPAQRNLSLVRGDTFYRTQHDIIVKNEADVYLDGQTGVDPVWTETGALDHYSFDSNGIEHTGGSPAQAVKTFAAAKKLLEEVRQAEGGNIIVSGRVDVTAEEHWSLEPIERGMFPWTPRLLRYNQPSSISGARYTDYLVSVEPGGELFLDGLTVDGNWKICESPRVFNSLIRVNGGGLSMSGGTRLTNNNAEKGGAVFVTGSTSLVEMYDAVIDHCTVDWNSTNLVGQDKCYGGALYLEQGCEFRMQSADSLITACGMYYYTPHSGNAYGAAVYVDQSRFLMNNGKITDCQLFRGRSVRASSYGLDGAIYTCGPRYNEETGEGTLVRVGGEISRNFLRINDTDWIYQAEYVNEDISYHNYPSPVSGVVLYAEGGTVEFMPELVTEFPLGSGNLVQVSPGANVYGNRTRGSASYWIYARGNNTSYAGGNGFARIRMLGGVIDGETAIDTLYSTASYMTYLDQYSSFELVDGEFTSIPDASYTVHMVSWPTLTIRGGVMRHNRTDGYGDSLIYISTGTVNMSGGVLTGNSGKNITGITIASGSANISGSAELYSLNNGINCNYSSASCKVTGGKIRGNNNGIYLSGGSATVSGGEIFSNSSRGINFRSANTCTVNGGDIHNNGVGIEMANSSGTMRISGSEVDIHHNWMGIACTSAKIFDVGTGVKIRNNSCGSRYESDPRGAGIQVKGDVKFCSIYGAEIYENRVTHSPERPDTQENKGYGGGIYIEPYNQNNELRSYSVTNCDIHDNFATGGGGGVAIYADAAGTSSNYMAEIHVQSRIYNNSTNGSGGGMLVYEYSSGKHTMGVHVDSDIHHNTASANGGGVAVWAGENRIKSNNTSTPPNPGRISLSIQFTGSHIDDNTCGGEGGGVYILRSDRNDVRVNMDFSMEGKARIPCSISHNTAASGGGLAIDNRRRSNNNNYPVINDTDITVTLSDTPMNGNTATGSYGGGVFVKDSASLYLNNVTLLGNTSALGGGGLAATSKGLAANGGASKVYVSQGQIGKNVAENGQGNGVYMDKGDLRLNNNYTVIDEHDDIWLNDRAYPITMWSSFTNVGAVYNVYPAESYVAGDIVVRPGVPFGGYCDEASFALANFYSIRPGTVIDRLYPNLILGRIVFLDGEYGLDPVFNSDGTVNYYQTDGDGVVHDGSTPEKAFRTFRASKAVLGDAPGAIYVSGTVHYRQDNEAEDDVWTLGEKQFLRRYCGFKVSSDRAYPGFTGDMFIVEQGTLTLENIPIEGSYKGTASFIAEGSVFAVNGETAKLVFGDGASVKDNITTGDGAAVRIERGECRMNAGEISGNTTTGRGVIWQGDTFTLCGDTLTLEGVVYLAAGDEENHTPDRVISVVASPATETSPGVTAMDFAPVNGHVFVNVENPYDGRDIVAYPQGDIPLSAQIERYPLSPPIDSMFVVDNDPFAQNVLELRLPYQVYLDGVNGDDARDGSTPEQAVRTLQRTYELIAAAYADPDIVTSGGLVHVVDTVTVADEISLSAQYVCGAVTVDAHGPVAFKRYAQPTAHASIAGGGFEKPTNLNSIFTVADGGVLNLVNVTVDGHKYAVPEGSSPKLTAGAVTAEAALVTVASGGTFHMSGGRLQSAWAKAPVPEGGSEPAKTGGALRIEEGGAALISGGAIDGCGAYLSASELIGCAGVEGVSIYDNGSLSFSGSPAVSGAVYLESPEVRMSVPAAFTPAGKVFVIPATAFNGRDIVRYDDLLSIPGAAQKASWDLPETVKQAYTLNNNAEDQRILELQLRACVYVDGVNGLDTNNGLTPESSVKSLQKAYTILSGLEGSTIYIVDNVTISSSTVLDGSVYESGATHIDAGSPVQIIRYAQPSGYDPEETDHGELNGFGVESYTHGPLLTVSGGVSVIISGVSVDGHGDPVTEGDVRYLSPGLETSAALLKVEEDGMLRITGSAMLQNNNNTLTVPEGEDRGEGGAIENHGRLILDAAVLRGNQALHGAGIYQDGTVELNGTASPVIDPDQYIYLTGPKAATEAEKPEEHLITVTGMLAEGFFVTVDLEYPELGRDVAHFAAGAFVSDVEGEKNHFVLAPGVDYVIVKSSEPDEPDTLELGRGYSLTIFKYADLTDLKEPNKTFLFEITDVTPDAESNGNTYYVYIGTYTDAVTGETVPAWVDNAYSYVSVTGLPEGVYTVRELTDWSWRYEVTDAWGADDEHYSVSDDFVVTVELDGSRTVYFRNTLTNPDYVNGYARSYSNTFCP